MFQNVLSYLKNKVSIFYFLIIGIIIATGVFLRLEIYIYNQGLWGDELSIVYSNLLNKSYLELFKPLDNYQVAPPLFLIISKFFFEIGKSINAELYADLGVRLFAFLNSTLSVVLFYLLLNKVFKNKIFITIALLTFSLNAIAINYSQEAKQYSTELLFSIILTYIFYSLNLKKDSTKKLFLYSLIITLSMWFSLSSLFVVGSGFIYLTFNAIKNKSFNKRLLILFIPFILSFIIWFFSYFIPVKNTNYDFMHHFWGILAHKFTKNNFIGLFSSELNNILPFFKLNFYSFAFFITGISVLFFKKEYKILSLSVLPVILCTIASYLEHYPFELRLILFLLPFFIICSLGVLLLVEENKTTYFSALIFILALILYQLTVPTSEFITYKTKIKEQMDYIKNEEKIAAIITYQIQAFDYYKKFANMNIKTLSVNFPYDEKNMDEVFQTLQKDKIYIFAMPSIAGIGDIYPNQTKKYIKENKKLKILKIEESKNDKNIFLIKFKKIK